MKQIKSKRFVWADCIRIIAIFLVIAVHLSYLPQKAGPSDILNLIYFAVAKTSIPLFVILSGALLLGKKESSSDFFSKRIKRLLSPWIFWTVIFMIIKPDYPFEINNLFSIFAAFTATLQSFWFLPMIFSLYLLTPFLRSLVQNLKSKEMLYFILLWFGAVSLLPYLNDSLAFPLHVDNGLVRQTINYLGYYLFGYYIISIKTEYFLQKGIFIFLTGLVWVLLQVIFKNESLMQYIIYFNYISPGIVLMSCGLFIVLFQFFNKNIFIKSYSHVVSVIAGASLGVYFLHGIVVKFVRFENFLPGMSAINTLNLFVFCLIIIVGLQQIPVVKKLVS